MSLPWTRNGDNREAMSPPAIWGKCRQTRQQTRVLWGMARGGLHSISKQGEMDTLGDIFLLVSLSTGF